MRLRGFNLPLLALFLSACGSGVTPDSARTTETFSGTVVAQGSSGQVFTAAADGNVDIVLSALLPVATITMGMGLGQPSGTDCGLISTSESVRVGGGLSGPIAAGQYCVVVYDIGNVQGSTTYTITVTHP
jgi:hypothetical protein